MRWGNDAQATGTDWNSQVAVTVIAHAVLYNNYDNYNNYNYIIKSYRLNYYNPINYTHYC